MGFTRSLAAETAGQIGVTLLIPGGMHTHFFDDRDPQYKPGADAVLNRPEDTAAAVVFALSQPLAARSANSSWPARSRRPGPDRQALQALTGSAPAAQPDRGGRGGGAGSGDPGRAGGDDSRPAPSNHGSPCPGRTAATSRRRRVERRERRRASLVAARATARGPRRPV